MMLLQSEETVTCADVSADGQYAAIADRGQVVRVWKLAEPAAPFRVIQLAGAGTPNAATKFGYENPVALSADGALVACAPAYSTVAPSAPAGSKEVHVISTATGQVVRKHEVAERPMTLRFLGDGTLAVGISRAGVHLHAPDGSPPVLIGSKTATCEHIAGTDELICLQESVSKWRLIARSGKPKPKLVDAGPLDHNGEVLVSAGFNQKKLTLERGKQTVDVELPAPIQAVAADATKVAVVTATAVHVLSAKDGAALATIAGDFAGVGKVRLGGGRLALWTRSMLREARPSAILLELDARGATAAPTVAAHRSEVIDVGFLGEEPVSIDKDGLVLGWGASTPRAVDPSTLSASWRLRASGDARIKARVRDAVELGDALLVATDAGALNVLSGAEQAVRVAAPALGILHQHLLPPATTQTPVAVAYGNESMVLVDAASRACVARTGGGLAAAVSSDGSFIARLTSGGYLHLHPSWCLPAGEQLTKLRANPLYVDVALNADDALILATSDGVIQLVDTVTLEERGRLSLGKRLRRIAVARGSKDKLAIAFFDGTTAAVTLPSSSTTANPGAALMERWNPALAPRILSELRRNNFVREEQPLEVQTPSGKLRLKRHLHELTCWRAAAPLHGNSPGVWSDVPSVVAFYEEIFKAKKTPREERRIDLGNIRFSGRAEVYAPNNGPRDVTDSKSALADPIPKLRIATVGDGEFIWTVSAVANEPDPFVTFVHTPTGTSELIEPLSEMLYRLVVDTSQTRAG